MLAMEMGLLVVTGLLEDEVTRLCGRRYRRQPDRVHTRYGHQQGMATLAGQKVSIRRPRVRQASLDSHGTVGIQARAGIRSQTVACSQPCFLRA